MFLLSAHQLVRYLVRTDATQQSERLLGLRTENISSNRSRNQCFLAFWGNGEAWFVKQAYFPNHYAAFDISNENAFYQFVADRELCDIQAVIPERVRYDPDHRILLLNRLDGFTPVPDRLYYVTPEKRVVDLRENNFPTRAAEVFKRIHLHQDIITAKGHSSPFIEYRPVLLQYQSGFIPQLLTNNPRAHGTFLEMLREALVRNAGGAVGHLDRLNQEWNSEHLLHGDAVFRNFMYRETKRGSVELRLVDWELTCWGDRRWDHALFFASYIKSSDDGHIPAAYIRTYACRFYATYYSTDCHSGGFEAWFETVLRLAAVALLQQTIDDFLMMLNQDRKRTNELLLARQGQRWFRLLCDPKMLFRPPNSYPDASPRISPPIPG